MERGSGILLHVTSLPSYCGIGNIGYTAYKFIDFLKESGIKYWQILPVNPVDEYFSPYSPKSSFAGEPLLIDISLMANEGFIHQDYMDFIPDCSGETDVDHLRTIEVKYNAFRNSFKNRYQDFQEEIAGFEEDHRYWLKDYALYMALRKHFNGLIWTKWEEGIKRREPESIAKYTKLLEEEIKFHVFLQFIFFRQWGFLRHAAKQSGVQIIGDIPIYVPLDSSDAWVWSHLFQLDESLNPTALSGAPPDYFEENGQLWATPVYDWWKHVQDNFDWWMRRISHSTELFDVVRLDHFRGFEAYWSVPAGEPNAKHGHWEKGPGKVFIEALKDRFKNRNFILEDLGYITEEVDELKNLSGYPGMSVIQFAFNGNPEHKYLPENTGEKTVIYTGTHDNSPLPLWLCDLEEKEFNKITQYLGLNEEEAKDIDLVITSLIKRIFQSDAVLAVIQMQDMLPMSCCKRMNTPGTCSGNWIFRVPVETDFKGLSVKLKALTESSNR
ncbi:MAG: 4-alpha-glucanotransferase [Eubacteriaceae bacterium]|nr:4-alpha-glucanotransferase [Eubacteriaceae bacterium]